MYKLQCSDNEIHLNSMYLTAGAIGTAVRHIIRASKHKKKQIVKRQNGLQLDFN